MVRHGETWTHWLHWAGSLSLGFFWFFFTESGPRGTPPPLVAALLITPMGAESWGSGRMRMICALVYFFHLRQFKINFSLPGRPSSALRLWDVVDYSEVAGSVRDRTWSNKKTHDMDGLHYSPDDPCYRLWPVHTRVYVRVTWDWWLGYLPRSPWMGEGVDWWNWPMRVTFQGSQFLISPMSLEYPFKLSVFNKNSTLMLSFPGSGCLFESRV